MHSQYYFSFNLEEPTVYTKPEPEPEMVPRKVTPEPYQPKPTTAEPKMVPPEPKVPPQKPVAPEPEVAKIKSEAPKVELVKKTAAAPEPRGKMENSLFYCCSSGKSLTCTVCFPCCFMLLLSSCVTMFV